MAQSSRRSWIGIQPTAADAILSVGYAAGVTSIVLAASQTWTTAPATGQVMVIVDGYNTEQVAVTTYASGTVTCPATANAHGNGTYVYFQAAATPAPTAYVPVTKIDAQDNIAMLQDKAFRGSQISVAGVQQGMRVGKLSFDGDFFPDTAGYWLNSLFGYYKYTATVASTTPTNYAFSQCNTTPANQPGQPAPVLVYVYSPATSTTRVYASAIVSDFSLKVDPGSLMSYSCTLMAYASGVVTSPATIPPAFSTFTPVASRVAQMSLAGTPSIKVETADFSWKRAEAAPINTLQGIQDPMTLFVGPLDLSIKAKLVCDSDTELNYYLKGTQNSVVLTANQGTLDAVNGIKVSCTKVNYDDANISRDKAYVEIDCSMSAIANATDVAPGGNGLSSSTVTLSTGTAGTALQYGTIA